MKDNGEFEEPDWDSYSCVYRKYPDLSNKISKFILATTTECYDCTTTSKYFDYTKD